ncbi:MAG: hypothetical protein EBY17_30035 [Acidobacteriia bacterium]|nr:hypothetical protein [Terriglobia bacterium]
MKACSVKLLLAAGLQQSVYAADTDLSKFRRIEPQYIARRERLHQAGREFLSRDGAGCAKRCERMALLR